MALINSWMTSLKKKKSLALASIVTASQQENSSKKFMDGDDIMNEYEQALMIELAIQYRDAFLKAVNTHRWDNRTEIAQAKLYVMIDLLHHFDLYEKYSKVLMQRDL